MTPGMRRWSPRFGRIGLGAAIALGLALPLVALAATWTAGDGSDEQADERSAPMAAPSFTRDVAPIIQEKCASCHQTGGVAPFAFESAPDISSQAPLIAAAVRAGVMPPWPPGALSPAYAGESERTLSAQERATIVAWAKAGGRIDGPARKPLPPDPTPVRDGERVIEVAMPTAYRPRAEPGTTDDYRCFVLDLKLAEDVSVTSARIEPGASKVVHHVILYRITAAESAEAARLDRGERGPGWTCFGGTGIGGTSGQSLSDANWIAAWAPGGEGGRLPDGTGVPLEAGSRIVMQVHYNLLNGRVPDRSSAVLTVAPASAGLDEVRTMLLPAPVELACAESERGRLCDRPEAVAELARKYGTEAAFVPAGLLFLCGRSALDVTPSPVSSCDRPINSPTKILVAAGHMHLLGSSIRIELNPGTSKSRVLLDIPRWDFHWQGSYTLAEPVDAKPGDIVRVTCSHDVQRRHHGTHGVPKTPRYILWGEGTTDEMCLGLLQVVSS
jgi:mono/diheme cytochrome c family protein